MMSSMRRGATVWITGLPAAGKSTLARATGELLSSLAIETLVLDGDEPTAFGFLWHPILRDGHKVGDLTNCAWSYRLKRNIGFALIATDCAAGERVEVTKDGRPVPGTLTTLPFL